MREYVVDPFETMRVAEIMTKSVEKFSAETPVCEVMTFFTAPDALRRHQCYPVVDADHHLIGMVTRADVLCWMKDGGPAQQSLGGAEAITPWSDWSLGGIFSIFGLGPIGMNGIAKH